MGMQLMLQSKALFVTVFLVMITARLSGVLLDKFTSAWFAPASRRHRT